MSKKAREHLVNGISVYAYLRCTASDIIIQLMEAKELERLELLKAHIDKAIEQLKVKPKKGKAK